jgi:hypothetical protein
MHAQWSRPLRAKNRSKSGQVSGDSSFVVNFEPWAGDGIWVVIL